MHLRYHSCQGWLLQGFYIAPQADFVMTKDPADVVTAGADESTWDVRASKVPRLHADEKNVST
jgi:hypothetical protein